MNKNTRKIRCAIRQACKDGEDSALVERPSRNYNSATSRQAGMSWVSFPTARVKGDGVNSVNRKRNSCQRIYLNQNNAGRTASLTCHEPHLRHESMIFKGHGYIDYRRPNTGPAAPSVSA